MNSEGFPGPAAEIAGIDPEVVALVDAMNTMPGIFTVDSCGGHGERPMCVYFRAENLEALPLLLYWFDDCHSGERWKVEASTDCAADHVTFCASSASRVGQEAWDSAAQIARCILAKKFVHPPARRARRPVPALKGGKQTSG